MFWFLAVSFIAVLAAVMTAAAYLVFPFWDDGWLALAEADGGSVRRFMGDRPLAGAAWVFLSRHGWLWNSGLAIHWLAWTLEGTIAMVLWTKLFPHLRCAAVAAGCLAVAPLVCTAQYCIVTAMLAAQVPTLLVYAAFLIQSREAAVTSARPVAVLRALATAALLVPAALLSDYTLPAVFATTVLLLVPAGTAPLLEPRRLIRAALFFAVGVAGYLVYWRLADSSARLEVRPEHILQSRGLFLPLLCAARTFPGLLWRGALGDLLHRMGTVDRFVLVVAGLGCAAIATWVLRPRNPVPADARNDQGAWYKPALLLAAAAAGIAPVALMLQRPPFATMGTRLWLPVLPILACLNVYLLLAVVRRRSPAAVVFLVLFLAAYFTVDESFSRIVERRRASDLSARILPQLDERGITVAMVDFDKPPSADCRDYELTARLSLGWPAEKRKRFWAFVDLHGFADCVRGVGLDRSLHDPAISVSARGYVVEGPVARMLWIRVLEDNRIEIVAARPDREAGSHAVAAKPQADRQHSEPRPAASKLSQVKPG